MRPLPHLAASGIIAAGVGLYFKSAPCALFAFLAGFLIDMDHFIDYFLNHTFTFKLKKIYLACLDIDLERLYLILHSYEIVIAFWLAIYLFALSNPWKAVAIGITQHLVIDQITNPIRMAGYLFTYRAVNGFRKEAILSAYTRR